MFARFRNLFSKNKNESEIETEDYASCDFSDTNGEAETSSYKSESVNGNSEEDPSQLEGLNLLKSIVENEQKGLQTNIVKGRETEAPPSSSLSEEVAELLEKRLSENEEKLSEEVRGLKEENGDHKEEFEEKSSEDQKQSEIVSENGDHKEESSNINNQENSQETSEETKLGEKENVSENVPTEAQEISEETKTEEKENVSEILEVQTEAQETSEETKPEENENVSDLADPQGVSEEVSSEIKTNEETIENNSIQEESNTNGESQNESVSEIAEKSSDSQEITEEDSSQTKENNLDLETQKFDTHQDEIDSGKIAEKALEQENSKTEPIELHITEDEDEIDSGEIAESSEKELKTLEQESPKNEPIELHISEDEHQDSSVETNETSSRGIKENGEVSEKSPKEETYDFSLQNGQENSETSNDLNEKEEVSEQSSEVRNNDTSLPNGQEISDISDNEKVNEEIYEQTATEGTKDSSVENSEDSNKITGKPSEETESSSISEDKEVSELAKSTEENLKNTSEENKETSLPKNNELSESTPNSNEINAEETKEKSEKPLESETNLENATSELNESLANNSENELETQQQNPLEQSNNSAPSNIDTTNQVSRENSPELSESSKSLSQSSVKENHANSTEPIPPQDSENNVSTNNSSIVVEDLPSEISTPTPTVDSTISGDSSNTSTLDSAAVHENHDPSKIIVNPIDNNSLACNAITNKLSDIAEVAESLDAVIREVQENVQATEVESNPSPSDKKLGTLRSTSSEDWHSRSTEDDSFATASEGNFTPHSHSSASFLTASGRTSSYISCDKNSFDASEADDSTYNFEMPELTSPLNMSFEGSEQSYLSAQQPLHTSDKEKTPTKLSETSSQTTPRQPVEEDQSSIADIEDLHSESVTPTPEDHYDDYHIESIPIESETELEVAGIANAPPVKILTEHTFMPMSKTPEVSPSTSNVCSNQNSLSAQISVNEAPDSNDMQEQQNTNNNNNKSNAAWRRSKYYENITKQTIKGFL